MHLPDGFLLPEVWIPLGTVSAGGIALALRQTSRRYSDAGKAPMVGLSAAFVFAAQMVNFPVASQVSGHFLGVTFLAILFGPWMTLLVMSAVLILQALLFQDGGITALGANVFNLAILANFLSVGIFRLVSGDHRSGSGEPFAPPLWGKRQTFAAFTAATFSTVAAAVAVAFELAPSGVALLSTLLALLAGSHTLIGLAEGFITVLVLRAIYQAGFDRRRLLSPTVHG